MVSPAKKHWHCHAANPHLGGVTPTAFGVSGVSSQPQTDPKARAGHWDFIGWKKEP